MGPKKAPAGKGIAPPGQSGGGGKPQKAQYETTKKKAVGVEDMTLLAKVSNEMITDNLQLRFENRLIYNYIGHVLISVNPYQDLGIYAQEILDSYVGKNRIEMPPHIFAIAEAAYRQLVAYSENQCVIISGESGAGKTEAAKRILQYIAAVSGGGRETEHVKEMVNATNPILEGFGNAKTLRNNNSSRFGKYFEIEFQNGAPHGGIVHNYLLEKSRVTSQIQGERNFHIFYQMCAGMDSDMRDAFSVQTAQDYVYLSQANCLTVDGIDDYSEWNDTVRALDVIGVSPQEKYDLFRLLSGILWLGNLMFGEQKDSAFVRDRSILDFVAGLFEISVDVFNNCLCQRMVETQRGGKRGTLYHVPLNQTQAAAVRDALAKAIYNRIFDWLVERINGAIATGQQQKMVIGVLDIYGFEIFDRNGFEQLCINYVNEKLQQIFIELTLKSEQEEYEREGIKWTPIPFFDNKIVCELIEGKKPPGIFSVMDDACATAHADPDAADRALMQRLGTLQGNKHFNLGGANFIIKHYAGDVTYEGTGLTEKNKDQLVIDLLECLKATKNQFLLNLFPEQVERGTTKKPTTAGFKIKTSCNALVTALMQCTPHYIRCIKPNDNKSKTEFNQKRVLHQVRYLGLLENIRVRRAGFAYRQVYDKFLERFFLLSRRTSYAGEYIWQGDAKSGSKCILEDCGISKEEWQMGTTKAFLRHPETLWALEHLRERYWHNMAMKIQRAWKNFLRYKHECATRIQRCYRKWVGGKSYYQIRDYGHQVLNFRKERRRFSLVSMRRFMGDYLEIRSNPAIYNACGNQIHNENIAFSGECEILVHRMLRSSILAPRFIVATDQAVYIIATVVEKNMARTMLERRIPLRSIGSVSLSPLMDDYVVLHVPSEYDTVLTTTLKTELVTMMASYLGGNLRVDINATIQFAKKPGKMATLTFMKDEMCREALFKKNKITIKSGSPANSVSDPPCRRNQKPAKPVTQGRLLKKGGPSAPAAAGGGGARKPAPASPAPAAGGGAKKPAPGPGAPAGKPVKPVAPPQDDEEDQPPPPKAAQPKMAAPAPGQPKMAAPAPKAAAPAPKPKEPEPEPPKSKSLGKYKSQYAYEKQDPGELSFPGGAILDILQKDENGWWLASHNGSEGWVPSNYLVEHVEEKPKPPAPAPAAKAPAPKPAPAAPKPAPADEDEAPAPAKPAPAQGKPAFAPNPAALKPAGGAAPKPVAPKPAPASRNDDDEGQGPPAVGRVLDAPKPKGFNMPSNVPAAQPAWKQDLAARKAAPAAEEEPEPSFKPALKPTPKPAAPAPAPAAAAPRQAIVPPKPGGGAAPAPAAKPSAPAPAAPAAAAPPASPKPAPLAKPAAAPRPSADGPAKPPMSPKPAPASGPPMSPKPAAAAKPPMSPKPAPAAKPAPSGAAMPKPHPIARRPPSDDEAETNDDDDWN